MSICITKGLTLIWVSFVAGTVHSGERARRVPSPYQQNFLLIFYDNKLVSSTDLTNN